MAKQVGVNPAIEQHTRLRTELASSGIEMRDIDQWIESHGINSILDNDKLLAQYFGAARRALHSITEWNFDNPDRALSAQTQSPENYQTYYQASTGPSTPYVDFCPADKLFDPEWLEQNQHLTPEQAQALKYLMQNNQAAVPQIEAPKTEQPEDPEAEGQWRMTPMSFNPVMKGYGTGGGFVPPPPPGFDTPAGEFPTSTQVEEDFVHSVNDPAMSPWIEELFGRTKQARSIFADMLNSMEEDRKTVRELTELMASLDPNDPKQASQIMVLREKINDVTTTQREKYDKLGQAQRYQNEFTELVKSIMDLVNSTKDAVIRSFKGS